MRNAAVSQIIKKRYLLARLLILKTKCISKYEKEDLDNIKVFKIFFYSRDWFSECQIESIDIILIKSKIVIKFTDNISMFSGKVF